MRWLVRFGYDGSCFAGWARQPGQRTVEGELLRGLVRQGIAPDAASADLRVASRTDRGVSARANALTVRSELAGPALLRSMNGIAPELFFLAATPVDDAFRVRGATRRTYRYYDPPRGQDLDRWRDAARSLVGRIDVRSFGRGLPSDRPVWRTVEALRVVGEDEGVRCEAAAPSFVWGMVRKMVAALREVDVGRLTLARLRSAASGELRLTLPLAEPEPLVLWDVEYPIAWEVASPRPSRAQERWNRTVADGLWSRRRVLEALGTASARTGGPPAGG
jgi:tRNA pseudouridine38-40 synthase